jgi:hypothetical protein
MGTHVIMTLDMTAMHLPQGTRIVVVLVMSAIYCNTLHLIKGHSGGATHTKTILYAVLYILVK